MELFRISAVDSVLESGKRKRFLVVIDDFHDALFLVQHFLEDNGYCVVSKPLEIPGSEYRTIDWYSRRAAVPPANPDHIVMQTDPVQFFSGLKKIDGMKKIFFHLTPVLLLNERETAVALVENLCAHCEEHEITLLMLVEKPEIFADVIGAIKNSFDYLFTLTDGKFTITSLKKPMDDVEFRYIVREGDVLLRISSGVERCGVFWSGGKALFWLPGSELLLPGGVCENSALFFSCDVRSRQFLIEQCVADALLSGRPCIFVSGETAFSEFAEKLKGGKRLDIANSKNFVFIDWFSWTTRKVIEVEDRGREMLVSRDIVYLGVAIEWALKKFDGKGVVVLDCLTAAAQNYNTEEICSFLSTMVARAKHRNYSVLSFGNPDVIGRPTSAAMACFHDGHILVDGRQIQVERSDTFFHTRRKFAVAMAADVLSVIPGVDRHEELSDEEIARVLKALDELLGNLPEEKITEFSQTEEFRIYERLLRKYGL
ncbi:MAG: hypothetical protein N3F63_01710 [Thermoplasmata archaeon]|nr:hypothetical protein [Thermoplasmata archaeon]